MPCCNSVPKKPNPRNPFGFGIHSCCAQISLRSQTMASVNVAVDITLKAASTKIPQFWDHKIILQEAARPQGHRKVRREWPLQTKKVKGKQHIIHIIHIRPTKMLQYVTMHCKAFISHPALGFPTSRPWPRYLQTCHFTVTAIHSRDWSRQNLNHWSLCEGCTMLYTCLRMLTFWKRVLQNTEGLISDLLLTWTSQNLAKADEVQNLCNLQNQQSLFKWRNLQPLSQLSQELNEHHSCRVC